MPVVLEHAGRRLRVRLLPWRGGGKGGGAETPSRVGTEARVRRGGDEGGDVVAEGVAGRERVVRAPRVQDLGVRRVAAPRVVVRGRPGSACGVGHEGGRRGGRHDHGMRRRRRCHGRQQGQEKKGCRGPRHCPTRAAPHREPPSALGTSAAHAVKGKLARRPASTTPSDEGRSPGPDRSCSYRTRLRSAPPKVSRLVRCSGAPFGERFLRPRVTGRLFAHLSDRPKQAVPVQRWV